MPSGGFVKPGTAPDACGTESPAAPARNPASHGAAPAVRPRAPGTGRGGRPGSGSVPGRSCRGPSRPLAPSGDRVLHRLEAHSWAAPPAQESTELADVHLPGAEPHLAVLAEDEVDTVSGADAQRLSDLLGQGHLSLPPHDGGGHPASGKNLALWQRGYPAFARSLQPAWSLGARGRGRSTPERSRSPAASGHLPQEIGDPRLVRVQGQGLAEGARGPG